MSNSIFLHMQSMHESEHLAHLYFNDSECEEVGAQFVLHGLKKKQHCLYVSDRVIPDQFIERLESGGVNLKSSSQQKCFERILISDKSDNTRDADAFIDFINNKVEKVLGKQSGLLRILMLHKGLSPIFAGSEKLRKNALLNKACNEKPLIVMSQYEAPKISSLDLLDIFETHPKIIKQNRIFDSPFYKSPENVIGSLEQDTSKYDTLTNNEKSILSRIVNGKSNRVIAEELTISIKTVETHRSNIMRKLDIHNLVDLVKFAIKNGIA